MLGIAGLTLSTVAFIVGVYLILDFYANKLIMAIPGLNWFSGKVDRNLFTTLIACAFIVFGSGYLSIGAITGTLPGVTAQTAGEQSLDIELFISGTDGTDFADTSYSMYLLDSSLYGSRDEYDIFAEVIDYGAGGLISPDGGTATAETVSSGKFVWNSINAEVGDTFVVWGYDDTVPAAGDYELFMTVITITGYNAEQGTWSVTPNRHQLYTLGAVDIVNYAGTAVNGYVEDEDSAVADKTFNYDTYCDADNNITQDMGLFIELDSTMQSRIDFITITPSGGESASTITSFQDVSSMDTASALFESAPAKQNSANDLYYVTMLPDTLRTSSTNKDGINIKVQYDHPGTGDHPFYLYQVHLTNAGQYGHFDISQSPAFTCNATASGTDAFTTP